MNWQPIENAPKDGTAVDLWTIDGERITNVVWSNMLSAWQDASGQVYRRVKFTHFMLITPPGEQQPESVNQRLLDAAVSLLESYDVLTQDSPLTRNSPVMGVIKGAFVTITRDRAAIEAAKQATKV